MRTDHPLAPGTAAPTTTAPTTLPTTTAPTRESATTAERDLMTALAALVQLALRTVPDKPVRWFPAWDASRAIVVRSVPQLTELVLGLRLHEYAGVEVDGQTGPWCQVMNMGSGGSEFLIELHPRTPDDEEGALLFERVVPVTASVAASFAWAWVRGKGLPQGWELELRIIPERGGNDQPL